MIYNKNHYFFAFITQSILSHMSGQKIGIKKVKKPSHRDSLSALFGGQ